MRQGVLGLLPRWVAFSAVFVAIGCSSQPPATEEKPKLDPLIPPTSSANPSESTSATLTPLPPPDGVSEENNDLDRGSDITLETGPLPIFEQFVQDHRGKIVAVDLWATHCVPCMQKFPKFLELSRKYAGEGVVFATISLDDGEDPEKPHAFLVDKGAALKNFLITDGQDVVQEKLEFEGIPHYLLYDREGNVHHFEDVSELAARLEEWQP